MIIEKVNFRKIMAVMLCLVIVAGATFIPNVSAQDYLHSGIYTYVLTESGAMIVGCEKEHVPSTLQIPETLNGVQVTAIGNSVFFYCNQLSSLTVPQGVTKIGSGAFESCQNLTSIFLPDSITRIENSSFAGCVQLSSVRWPNYLREIGSYSFSYTALTVLVLPNTVEKIEDRAFYYCKQLTMASLPENIQRIGYGAFSQCTSLTSINIPESIQYLDRSVLEDTPFLKALNWNDDGLYINDILLSVNPSVEGVFTVKNGTKLIASGAFRGCEKITEIIIPDGIRTLSNGTFDWCGVKTIHVSDSVERIEAGVFPSDLEELYIGRGVQMTDDQWWLNFDRLKVLMVSAENEDFCVWNNTLYNKERTRIVRFLPSNEATDFTIPNTVTTIGANAFKNCSGLQAVTLPDSLKTIDVAAFEDCTRLKHIMIPDGVQIIEKSAFCRCESLSQIELGNNVQTIESGAFYCCTSLQSIELPNSVTKLGYRAFGYCSALASMALPDSLREIEHDMFTHCSSLQDVSIPDTVSMIDGYSFENCTSLQKIDLPDHLEWVGNRTFFKCTSLSEIKLPDSVMEIGEMSFMGCTQLTKVRLSERMTEIPANAFRNTAIETIQIPASVSSVSERAFLGCSNLKTITVLGELTNIGPHILTGTAYYADETHWSNHVLYLDHYLIAAEKIISGEVRIKSNTALIANAAFINCTALTKAAIPDSVSTICDAAFSGCTALTFVSIPASVKTVSADAFSHCDHLETISVPHQVTDICYNAFRSCSALKKVQLPKSLSRIGEDAFEACSSISDVRYAGTEEDWNTVFVENGNEAITQTIFHYTVESTIAGINAQYKNGCFQGKVSLIAEKVERTDLTDNYSQYEFALTPPPGEELTDIYMIRIVDETGTTVQPKEGYAVTLWIPIPLDKDYTKCRVCHVIDAEQAKTESYKWNPLSGGLTKPFTVSEDGQFFIIEVTSFSPFIVFVEEDIPTVSIRNNPGTTTLRYGETLMLTADAENPPDGAKLVWEAGNDCVALKPSADGTTCEVISKKNGTVTVTVKIVDASGSPIEADGKGISDSETIRSKATFFYKLIAFFKRLFGIYVKTTQAIPTWKSEA